MKPTTEYVLGFIFDPIGERVEDWQHVCELRGERFCIYVYATYSEQCGDYENREDRELINRFFVNQLPHSVIPNLRWMIPMALSLTRGESATSFVVHERR